MTISEIVIEFEVQFDDRARFKSRNLEKMLNFEKRKVLDALQNIDKNRLYKLISDGDCIEKSKVLSRKLAYMGWDLGHSWR